MQVHFPLGFFFKLIQQLLWLHLNICNLLQIS